MLPRKLKNEKLKKKYLKIFGIFISIIILIGIFYYNKFCNYYKSGENNNFELKVGETLEIRLYENGSTGFSNCWLNENRSKKLKLVNRKYENSLYAKLGSEGAGGIITLIFKAYEKGIDTIKIGEKVLSWDMDARQAASSATGLSLSNFPLGQALSEAQHAR